MRSPLLAAIFAAALTLSTAAPAVAANVCWDVLAPQTGGDWNTPSNWSGGVPPGPGDTAVLDEDNIACSRPASVVVSGTSAGVGFVKQGPAKIVIDGGGVGDGLTVGAGAEGIQNLTQFLGDVDVHDSGALKIAAGAEIRAGGTVTLGGTGNGSLLIEGTLRTITAQYDILEPSGGGLVSIAQGGSLVYAPGTAGVLRSQLDNDGAIELQQEETDLMGDGLASASVAIHASSGTPESEGSFTISPLSTLALRPTRGALMPISGTISGGGNLEVSDSDQGVLGAIGTVALRSAATLDVGRLTIGSPCELEIAGTGTTGHLVLPASDAEGDGRRGGAGTLTAATATIEGGHLLDGVTKVTGQTGVNGGDSTPAIHNGATLLTEGLTAWQGGAVTLGAAGEPDADATWQNAGTLAIANAPQLLAGSDDGMLRNVAGATISRRAPAGEMVADATIVNAGTVNVVAGAMGLPAGATTGAFKQEAGVTTIAEGAALAMNATLTGGVLRGLGTVRSLSNPGGLVEPGGSPGALTVGQDFTQGPDGTLVQEIAGPAVTQFDRLLVGGHATLAGTLEILTAPSYVPVRLTSYKVVQSATRSGEFTHITGAKAGESSYAPDYLSDGAQLCFYCGPLSALGLSVTLSGAGSGSVTSDVAGIACEPDCAEEYAPGTALTLTARPASGSVFAGWSGICDGLGPCAVTMSEARNITATFAPAPPPEPAASASVTTPSSPAAQPRIQVAGIVVFPSTRKCISTRLLRIRLRVPRGVTATSARVLVNGKLVKVLRGSKLAAPVDLRGLKKGRVKVDIAISLADGRTVRDSRSYRTCGRAR